MPSSTSSRSKIGHWCRNRWYSSLVQNPITCSTPARLYQLRSNSTISPGRRQVLDVALEVPLGLLPLGRRGQRDDPGDPRVEVLGDPLDRAALARRVAALEDHDDPGAARRAPTPGPSPARPAAGTARPRTAARHPFGPLRLGLVVLVRLGRHRLVLARLDLPPAPCAAIVTHPLRQGVNHVTGTVTRAPCQPGSGGAPSRAATAIRSRAGPAGSWAGPAHTARSRGPGRGPVTGPRPADPRRRLPHREQAEYRGPGPGPYRLADRRGGAQPQSGRGQLAPGPRQPVSAACSACPVPDPFLPFHQRAWRPARPGGPGDLRRAHGWSGRTTTTSRSAATTRDRSPRGGAGPSTKPRSASRPP